jgi:hypothetical protein
MGLSIKNKATVTKVRRLARLKRKGLTEVVDEVVTRELERLHPRKGQWRLIDIRAAVRQIQRDYAAGPLADRERRRKVIDARVRRIKSSPAVSAASEDEILGYNDKGYCD